MNLAALKDLTVGTTQLSAGHEYLMRHGFTKLHFYARLVDALTALDHGECDAVLAVRLFGRHFIEQEKLGRVIESDIDVSDMQDIKLDTDAQLATVQTGLPQDAIVNALGAHDFAIPTVVTLDPSTTASEYTMLEDVINVE